MQTERRGKWAHYALVMALLMSVSGTSVALATTSSSSNYQVTETQFGASSTSQTCSGQYCARTSIGDMSPSDGKSASYSAKFGAITDSDPLLEVIVDPGTSDLGVLTTEKTATKTMIVRVRNYLSDGYTLQITGNAPTVGGHSLKTPSAPTASTPGTEQFAINAAANTMPSVGAAPVQIPSSQTSFGAALANYNMPNLFMYTSGGVVAKSTSSSGETDYTISMIVNISNSTPAGHYSGDFSAVVVPVY